MPLVSVIIPTYNRIDYICEAIDSVLVQTYEDYEIIVVDDGSTKVNVRNALEPYMHKIKYIYQENKGLAAARNTGINNSNGKFLAFLDDDDLFEPNKLEIQSKILEKNPDVGVVYSDCYVFDTNNSTKVTLNLAVAREQPSNGFAKLFFMSPNVLVPTLFIRRKCFEDVGLFDDNLPQHEDGDMLLRIALNWKVKFSEYPSARVRQHTGRMSKNRIGMYKSMIYSSKKIFKLNPEFEKSLGNEADETLSKLYFLLGREYLMKKMIKSSIIQFYVSRKLSKKYISVSRICKYLLLKLRLGY